MKYLKIDKTLLNKRLHFSYQAAKLIEDYAHLKPKNSKNLFELALFIYKEIKASFEVAVCMAKLGRLSAMMDFVKSKKEFANNPEIYFKIIKECPSIELANEIMERLVLTINK